MLYNTTGQITTPNYPAPYQRSLIKCWLIAAKENQIITLTFKAFDLKQSSPVSCSAGNYLDILERPGTKGEFTRLGRYCGEISPNFLESSRNTVKLLLMSPRVSYNGGFKILYSIEDGKTYFVTL